MKTFEFNGRAIRYFMADGDVYFVLHDIGNAAGYSSNISHKNFRVFNGVEPRLFRNTTSRPHLKTFTFAQIKTFLEASSMPFAWRLLKILEEKFGKKSEEIEAKENEVEEVFAEEIEVEEVTPEEKPTQEPPSDVQLFSFAENEIRVVVEEDNIWFVVKDVAKAVGITSDRNNISKLDDDEKGTRKIRTHGGSQMLNVINESGLYTFIIRSHGATEKGSPQHKFRKWVTDDVLPSIRKTGRYEHNVKSPKEDDKERALRVSKLALEVAEAFGFRGNQKMLSADHAVKSITGVSALELMDNHALISERKEQLLTPTQLGEHIGLSARETNKLLRDCGLLMTKHGEWWPTEAGFEHCEVLDVAKKQGQGTPVKQIKWYDSVLEVLREKISALKRSDFHAQPQAPINGHNGRIIDDYQMDL